uniref:Uncharacterized protein n=1 Tax=Oryza punctata TaxID=4537 RepID=A0A0E0KNK1_ORYPU
MASPAAEAEGDAVSAGFAELEWQQLLLASCTRLYKQLEEHFASLERGIAARSDSLHHKRRATEARASRLLAARRGGRIWVEEERRPDLALLHHASPSLFLVFVMPAMERD